MRQRASSLLLILLCLALPGGRGLMAMPTSPGGAHCTQPDMTPSEHCASAAQACQQCAACQPVGAVLALAIEASTRGQAHSVPPQGQQQTRPEPPLPPPIASVIR